MAGGMASAGEGAERGGRGAGGGGGWRWCMGVGFRANGRGRANMVSEEKSDRDDVRSGDRLC